MKHERGRSEEKGGDWERQRGGKEPSDFSPAASRLHTLALSGKGALCSVTTDKTSFKTGPATCSVIQHKLLTFPTISLPHLCTEGNCIHFCPTVVTRITPDNWDLPDTVPGTQSTLGAPSAENAFLGRVGNDRRHFFHSTTRHVHGLVSDAGPPM